MAVQYTDCFCSLSFHTHTKSPGAFSDFARRPGPVGLVGLKAAAEKHVDGALDLCVPVGVDDGVDHGVVRGGQQCSVGVHRWILLLAHQAVDGEGQPAGAKSP